MQDAKEYLEQPILGQRLREVIKTLLELPETDPMNIFGWAGHNQVFDGQEDPLTLDLLKKRGYDYDQYSG